MKLQNQFRNYYNKFYDQPNNSIHIYSLLSRQFRDWLWDQLYNQLRDQFKSQLRDLDEVT